MSGLSIHMVFSPQNCALEQLDATLTPDRRALADRLIAQVEAAVESGGSRNHLVVGPRGTGKTHVLAYVRKRLEEKYSCGRTLKIIALSEEERGLANLFDFLVACLRAAGVDNERIIERLSGGNSAIATEAAIELFREATEGMPTLVILENLSDLFDKLGEGVLSELRAFLQSHAFVSLLASSVGLFAQSSKPDHPFYGYFTIHPLELLDAKEARSYLGLLAQSNGDEELARALRDESSQARVNAIHHLTGGNHRLLAMLSAFLTVDGLADLVGPFVQMADRELTPYYQQRLDRLSPQQYKIIQAIADQHGRALNVSQIASYSFLSPQVVSRLLHDLLHEGFVARHPVGRESYYELREPLLRLILDIKQGRDTSLPRIVTLLREWYEGRGMPWLQWESHMREPAAVELGEEEMEFGSAVRRHPETTVVLDMLSAARRHAMGDRKALLELPIELRQLILQTDVKGQAKGAGS